MTRERNSTNHPSYSHSAILQDGFMMGTLAFFYRPHHACCQGSVSQVEKV